MSCRQNLEKQRLRIIELNLYFYQTYYLPLWRKSRSEVKGNRQAAVMFAIANGNPTFEKREGGNLVIAAAGENQKVAGWASQPAQPTLPQRTRKDGVPGIRPS
jgi:hypothetical protein